MRRARVGFAIRDNQTVFRKGDRRLALGLAASYAALAVVGGGLAVWLGEGRVLTSEPSWLRLSLLQGALASLAMGLTFAGLIILWTRFSVARFTWAKQLHRELRPVAQRLSLPQALSVAVLSSLGEELFFRSFLVPLAGIWGSSLLFGLLHQVRGESRFVWALWATLVGLCFAVMFQATGSLLGPLVAHALINGVNLRFLCKHDVDALAPATPVEATPS